MVNSLEFCLRLLGFNPSAALNLAQEAPTHFLQVTSAHK